MRNNTNSPTAGEGSALPPPPYDLSHYGQPFPINSPTGASLSSHHIMSNSMMRPPSQQSSNSPVDNMVSKPPSAPPLFTNMGPSVNPPSAYSYSGSTPVSQSPHSANGPAQRQSPDMRQSQMPPHPSQSPFIRPPYPSYTLPAMPGPAMTNINSPGGQMSMVGNNGGMLPMAFNSGFAANPQHMYGQQRTNSPQQAAQNDRPFRCDSCPQSFHRNHDLKRHKRIHLAVKPYPCTHCDKSFSRKDALKVSLLIISVAIRFPNISAATHPRQRMWQPRIFGFCNQRWRQVRVGKRHRQRKPSCTSGCLSLRLQPDG